jgi:hypothetical protein
VKLEWWNMVAMNPLWPSFVVQSLGCALLAASLTNPLGAASVNLQPPKSHGGFAAFGYSPDGRMLAGGTGAVTMSTGGQVTASAGGEVVLWDATTGKLSTTLGSHGSHVRWVGFAESGKVLASASPDNGVLKTWDPVGRKALASVELPEKLLLLTSGSQPLCAISPDGKRLAAVGDSRSTVGTLEVSTPAGLSVWDAASGKVLWKVADSGVAFLTFSSDSTRLIGVRRKMVWRAEGDGAAADISAVRLVAWDATTGKQAWETPLVGSGPSRIFLPEQGKEVLLWDGPRSAWYDSATGAKVRAQRLPQTRTLVAARIDSTGKKVVGVEFPGERVVSIDLDAGTSTVVQEFKGFPNRVTQTAIAPDLRHLVAGRATLAPSIIDY